MKNFLALLFRSGRAQLALVLLVVLGVSLHAAEHRPEPPFKWRVIEPWLDPDGKEFLTHGGCVLTWDAMLHLTPESPLGLYFERIRALGFNGLALHMCDLEANPPAIRAMCRYLKGIGISVFIRHEWCEPETGKSHPGSQSDGRPRASSLVNPYNPEVRAYWEKRIARDYELVPELGGYRIWGTEFYIANGAPWQGEGPEMAGKTGRECARDAIRLAAEILGKHGGTLFWETCQDDPWGQRHEFHYFRDLQGEIPANAFIVIKDYYWDYRPAYPRHPLFEVQTHSAKPNSQYLTSMILPSQATGVNDFPSSYVAHLVATMKDIVAAGHGGVWIMDQPLPAAPWDHPLNLVNWYALDRLLRNPRLDSAEALTLAWAREQYGEAAAPTVVQVIEKASAAATGMYEFDGLWNAKHSYLPTLEYLDSHLCGPYRQTPRMKGLMGMLFPLDMFPPAMAEQIRADPKRRLVFNQAEITPKLKAEAMAQKLAAVDQMRDVVARWKSLRGRIPDAAQAEILAGLEGNLTDAIVFHHMMDLYFDWKLGTLTEAKIDAALADVRGMTGRIVPQPLEPNPPKVNVIEAVSLKSFAEQLRQELREPRMEAHWRDNQLGSGMVDPVQFKDGSKMIKPP